MQVQPASGNGSAAASTATGPVGPNGPIGSPLGSSKFTSGWYVAAGITGAIILGGTPLAPVAAGLLTLALIYNLNQLVQGK